MSISANFGSRNIRGFSAVAKIAKKLHVRIILGHPIHRVEHYYWTSNELMIHKFSTNRLKNILFLEKASCVLPQATGVLPRYRGKTPFCKVLGKGVFFNISYDIRVLSLLCFVDKCSRYLMEKELSHYLQNFAIQSQLSKRYASYPTIPYVCLLPSGVQSGAEVSGITRVYHNHAGPGWLSACR